MSRLLYHVLVSPLGRLPHAVLYLLADALAVLIWWSGYRKKVVLSNLERAFPEEDQAWRKRTAKAFFTHLAEVLVESIRHFHASEAELLKRYHHVNPEVLEPFLNRAPGVLLSCGHYGNWERYAVTAGASLPMPVMGVYKPLSNSFYDQLILETRGKFGTELAPMKRVSSWMLEEAGRAKDRPRSPPRGARGVGRVGALGGRMCQAMPAPCAARRVSCVRRVARAVRVPCECMTSHAWPWASHVCDLSISRWFY